MRFIGVSDLIMDFYYKENDLIGVTSGGSCSNVLSNLASFGNECYMISCSGSDQYADLCIKSLIQSNIVVNNRTVNNIKTKQFHINIKDGVTVSTKKCPMCNKKHFYNDCLFNEEDFETINGDILIVDNISNPYIKKIKDKKAIIMLDLGHEFYFKEMSDEFILEQLSVGYEIVQMTNKVYKYLLSRFNVSNIKSLIHAKVINVTCSDKGNIFFVNEEKLEYNPNLIYSVVDETGAGDAYFSKLIDLYVKNDFNFSDFIPKLCNEYVENIVSRVGATTHVRGLNIVEKVNNKCSCEEMKSKERRKPNRCLININNMISRVNKAIDNYDRENLTKLIDSIQNKNVIVTGSGGSYASAVFIAHFLNSIHGVNSFTMYPRDIVYRNNSNIDNLICLSYSGTTQDMLYSINNANVKNATIITKGNKNKVSDKIKNVNVISYYGSNNKSKERGFFSFEGTMSPCSVILDNYLKEKNIDIKLFFENRFNYWKKFFEDKLKKFKKNMKIDVIYDFFSSSAAFDIESKAVESGCFNVLLHEKKNFSHGRFINYEFNSSDLVIYLKEKKTTNYEEVLIDYFSQCLLVESDFDGILAEYDLLLASQLLFYTFAKLGKIDLAKPNYSDDAMKLYFYKGEL